MKKSGQLVRLFTALALAGSVAGCATPDDFRMGRGNVLTPLIASGQSVIKAVKSFLPV